MSYPQYIIYERTYKSLIPKQLNFDSINSFFRENLFNWMILFFLDALLCFSKILCNSFYGIMINRNIPFNRKTICSKAFLLLSILTVFPHVLKVNTNNLKRNLIDEKLRVTLLPKFSNNLNDFRFRFGCQSQNIDQGRSYEETNISLYDCFFSRFSTYSGYGGVIYVSTSSNSMTIDSSMFYQCSCSYWGGAIYFLSAHSYIRMTCSNGCFASSMHFARFQVSESSQIEYLSVTNCSYTSSGVYSFLLVSAAQILDNTNSSMNKAEYQSGFGISDPSSFTSSHCTFSNNIVANSRNIYIYTSTSSVLISYANIIQNNSPSQYGVLYFDNSGSKKMKYCVFQNNQDYLFCVKSGSLEVSHSFIDHSSQLSRSFAITTINISKSGFSSYPIPYFNSHYCNADVAFPNRTIEQTLINSPEITIVNTPEITILNTPEETLMKTPQITDMDSSLGDDSKNNLFLVLFIVVLSIVLIYIAFFLIGKNFKQDSSNNSISKSEGLD